MTEGRRWRWRVRRLRGEDLVGEWTSSPRAAQDDAVRHGMAKDDPEHGFFMDVFTGLEQEGPQD
jgi:hypothetical protein